MTIYLFEYLHAMLASEDCAPDIEHEGFAMLERLAHDLEALPDTRIKVVLHEHRRDLPLPYETVWVQDGATFADLLSQTEADGEWYIIAPEFDGNLSQVCHELAKRRIRYHGLPVDLIDLFSDKLQTFEKIGPPVLHTTLNPSNLNDAARIVAKPRFGCGSLHVSVTDKEHIASLVERIRSNGYTGPLVYQPWIEGNAVSMAVIGHGAEGYTLLPLADQCMSLKMDGPFAWMNYEGGQIPSAIDAPPVRKVVEQILDRLPPFHGYIGFDLIVPSHGQPVVIEVNPRLTTSYVGYSHGFERWTGKRDAFARLLLGIDRALPAVGSPIRFNSDGSIVAH